MLLHWETSVIQKNPRPVHYISSAASQWSPLLCSEPWNCAGNRHHYVIRNGDPITYLPPHCNGMSFPRVPEPWSRHLSAWMIPRFPNSSWILELRGPCILQFPPFKIKTKTQNEAYNWTSILSEFVTGDLSLGFTYTDVLVCFLRFLLLFLDNFIYVYDVFWSNSPPLS